MCCNIGWRFFSSNSLNKFKTYCCVSFYNPPGRLGKNKLRLQPLLITGCVWACRLGESSRSLQALPEAWIPGSGLDHITVNIKLTLTSALCWSADSTPTGGERADETRELKCVTTEQNNWTNDAFMCCSLKAFSMNRHYPKNSQINMLKFASGQSSVHIYITDDSVWLPLSPVYLSIAKPERGSRGQRGAEELHQQRSHLRVGGLSARQPGPYHQCH